MCASATGAALSRGQARISHRKSILIHEAEHRRSQTGQSLVRRAYGRIQKRRIFCHDAGCPPRNDTSHSASRLAHSFSNHKSRAKNPSLSDLRLREHLLTRQVLSPSCRRSTIPQTKNALSISTSEMKVSRRRILFPRSEQTVARCSSRILSPRLAVLWRCNATS
jgi:hypothetical protein